MAGICLLVTNRASAFYDVSASAGRPGIGSGRLLPGIAALVGLIGVVLGRRALARAGGGGGNGNRGASLALGLGLISAVVGALHAANSAGGFGTGNGLAGAVVAIVAGLIGVILGGLALAGSLHQAAQHPPR